MTITQKVHILDEDMALAYVSGDLDQDLWMFNAFSLGKCQQHGSSDFFFSPIILHMPFLTNTVVIPHHRLKQYLITA